MIDASKTLVALSKSAIWAGLALAALFLLGAVVHGLYDGYWACTTSRRTWTCGPPRGCVRPRRSRPSSPTWRAASPPSYCSPCPASS
jgi:hypothetical protein